ncbi:MAG: sugar phosphate isomerase/epimerase [Clostridia bacterium]|nr:sugar phosphate isomerase/epimerase [Clostridia bacterium]
MKRRIVTTTAVFDPGYPAEKAAKRLATLGYEALDMALDYWTGDGSPFLSDTYLAWAESLRKLAEGLGIPYTHSHAPGETDGRLTARSIETAGALGAGFMVLHPIWRENGEIIEDRDRFIRVNADAVKPWLATAKDAGVVILSENLLWGASKDPRIIAELAAAVGSEQFGWCFDTGHANSSPIGRTFCAPAPCRPRPCTCRTITAAGTSTSSPEKERWILTKWSERSPRSATRATACSRRITRASTRRTTSGTPFSQDCSGRRKSSGRT